MKLYRQLISVLFAAALSTAAAAEPVVKISDVFRQMPDSLLPYLTANNRLDFLDFMESGMKAEVTNRFDGLSQMTVLTADSLSIILSPALQVDMVLLDVEGQPIDSCQQVVCMQFTVGTANQPQELITRYYTIHWAPVNHQPPLTPASKARLADKKPLTVIKWYTENLKKQ